MEEGKLRDIHEVSNGVSKQILLELDRALLQSLVELAPNDHDDRDQFQHLRVFGQFLDMVVAEVRLEIFLGLQHIVVIGEYVQHSVRVAFQRLHEILQNLLIL